MKKSIERGREFGRSENVIEPGKIADRLLLSVGLRV